MGKGGGCVPSKKKHAPVADNPPQPAPSTTIATSSLSPEPSEDHVATTTNNNPTDAAVNFKVFIVFYSIYGHVELLARRMKKGVDGVEGVEAVLYRVPETLSSEVLEKMKAPPKDPSIPDITEAADLVEADGILFGFPTRYRSMSESWVRKEEGKEEGGKRKPAAVSIRRRRRREVEDDSVDGEEEEEEEEAGEGRKETGRWRFGFGSRIG
ncbi:Probable NAD(P)H dehydrogenase (quinone) FQR1-like 2 [Linum perenne]